MRVLINAASAHMGGSVTYLQNVLQWLPEVAPRDEFIVCVPSATRARLPSQDGVTLWAYPYSSTQGLRRLYFDQVTLPRVARAEDVDVLFSSTGFGTLWSPVPQVLLIRNMAYFDPQFRAKYRALGRSLTKNTLRRWHSLLSIRRADVVLFPTRAMRAIVEQYLSLPERSARVLHYGFDADRFRRKGGDPSAAVQRVRRWKDDGGPVLLNVSTYAVHKNLETLIEALPAVREIHPDLKLLTTTSRERTSDKVEYDALRARASALGVTDTWTELGYVPYRELPALYQIADVYVFPSFAESFGHSMVEAMASGLPIVAAGTPVNREVCERAGCYFDTFDPEDCARVICDVLAHPEKQNKKADASRKQAQSFSWRRYTKALVEIFRTMR